MNFFRAIGNFVGSIFGVGSATNGKSIVTETNDIVERWKPSPAKEHEMGLEQLKAEDASQDSARKYQPNRSAATGYYTLDFLNTLVDVANRIPRPAIALWAACILFGWIEPPAHLNSVHPLALNIIWSVIGFFFGIRTVSQDIPKLIQAFKK